MPPAKASAAPPADASAKKPTPRKSAIQAEAQWLRDNGGVILNTKRARPKITYTAEDRRIMDLEEDDSAYDYSSDCSD